MRARVGMAQARLGAETQARLGAETGPRLAEVLDEADDGLVEVCEELPALEAEVPLRRGTRCHLVGTRAADAG
jgi:hypothetical protein